MFEHHSHPLLPQDRYLRRLALSILAGLSVIVLSLGAGMTGYHVFESLSWLDSFLNASMLLSGMGPLTAPQTDNGKLFAGLYALYCGFVVILVSGMVFAPVVHRTLHRFHLEPTHHAHRTTPPPSPVAADVPRGSQT